MKIHKYQAKQILHDAGVAVPRGIVADTPHAVVNAFHALGSELAVIKAQIHAGGRGKGTIQDIPDQLVGTSFVDLLKRFDEDPETEGVLLIDEIGGTAEEEAAAYVAQSMRKPVAALVAGRMAPPGKRMGHAGAIISGGKGTAAEKIAALERAGVLVAQSPAEMGTAVERALSKG